MDVLNRSIGTRIKLDVKLLAVAAYQFQTSQMPELEGFNTPEFVEKSIRDTEIGRASCRETVYIWVVGG